MELDARTAELIETILLVPIPGDWPRLDDDTLLAALDCTRALRPEEMDALMASPLTLRRLFHLAEARKRVQARQRTPDRSAVAANDAYGHWLAHGSRGVRRAAASGDDALPVWRSDDRLWSVTFERTEGGETRIVLRLELLSLVSDSPDSDAARCAQNIADSACVLEVADRDDRVLITGVLDEALELRAPWPDDLGTPGAHLARVAGQLTVRAWR